MSPALHTSHFSLYGLKLITYGAAYNGVQAPFVI